MIKVNDVKTIERPELINRLAERTGYPKRIVREVLLAYEDEIIKALKAGEEVRLYKFGKFGYGEYKETTITTPQGKQYELPACKRPRFAFSRNIKDMFKPVE